MNIKKLPISSDLSQASLHYALCELKPEEFPAVIILKVSIYGADDAKRCTELMDNLGNVYWNIFVEGDYEDSEWSIECRDKMITSKGA